MAKEAVPSNGGPGNFKNFATTQEEEDAFDYTKWRNVGKTNGILGSTAHMVKGALGAGILGGHVAYMKSGVVTGVIFHFIFGLYISYCLYLLVKCSQTLNKRTRVPVLSYSDVGEAAVACFQNPKVSKYSKTFRYIIDTVICIDLFGACSVYQIMISKTIKQLVENTHHTGLEGAEEGYPGLRVYMAVMIIPIVMICLIIHLKWLAPFSLCANLVILIAICFTIYYAFKNNPTFENMVPSTTFYDFFEYAGITVFSMSCAGVVIPIENHMKNPAHYNIVLVLGMSFIILASFATSFFGYAAFLDKCESPITINFPMALWPKMLKGGIAIMIYVTHALNFWVPFNICFYYIAKKHKGKRFMWELIYRAVFVVLIGCIAITFPSIDALMGVVHFPILITRWKDGLEKLKKYAYGIMIPTLGTLCLSNMAFIWPNLIYLLIVWHRPGLGKYNWRFWLASLSIMLGLFLMAAGTIINANELFAAFFQ